MIKHWVRVVFNERWPYSLMIKYEHYPVVAYLK